MAYLDNLRALAARIPTASHDELDAIHAQLSNIKGRGRRPKLADRRTALANMVARKIANTEKLVAENAARDAFIGPRTLREQNGHPF